MATGAREGHFEVFSNDPMSQSAIERLGAGGRFTLGPNPIAIVWQDASANRAGYFAELGVSTSVAIASDGSASIDTTVTMMNRAPDGPPSLLLGGVPGTGSGPTGWWGVDIEAHLPASAANADVTVDKPSITRIDGAATYPIADAFLYADPGEGAEAEITYDLESAATRTDDTWTYVTEVRPQPWLRPIPHTVEFVLPEGSELEETPSGATVEGSVVRWTGSPTEPIELRVEYRM
jgi:hypothetical protein